MRNYNYTFFPNFPFRQFHSKVGKFCLLIFLFLGQFNVAGQPIDSFAIFQYPTEAFSSISLMKHIKVYPVKGKSVSSENILNIDTAEFINFEDIPNHFPIKEAWGKFSIKGSPEGDNIDFLQVSTFLDTVELYRKIDSQLVWEATLGCGFPSSQKMIPYYVTYHPLNIQSNTIQTYYYRVIPLPQFHNHQHAPSGLWLNQGKPLMHRLLTLHSQQYFFVGFMFLFSLMSFFLFYSFKEWMFIYYSGLVMSLTLYFVMGNRIFGVLVSMPDTLTVFKIQDIAIAGIMIFGCLFISTTLQLPDYRKRLFPWYLGYSILLGVGSIVHRYIFINVTIPILFLNSGYLIWIIFTLFVILDAIFQKKQTARMLLTSLLLLVGGAIIYILGLMDILPRNSSSINSFQIGVLIFSTMLFYGLFRRIRRIQKDRTIFRLEKEKSRTLLFNVLPSEVAEELMNTGDSPAKYFEEVTVLFTDFKDFTSLAAELTPQELVNEINVCFKAFDEIISRYQIEKIKTIGDAYMAAGGLHQPRTTEVKDIVKAALEMQTFITNRKKKRDATGQTAFEMRVGIHTGTVVAGIVGVKKFQYDIWGDTVNIASRMESNGAVGKVNISQPTYELLKDYPDFSFESRGEIMAKGKGAIEMWFVNS